jgi:cytochrome P450
MTTTTVTKSKIPGPRGLPFLKGKANLPKFYLTWATYLRELHETYGDIVGLAEGDPSWTFVFSPALNHDLLANPETFRNDAGPFVRLPKGSRLAKLFLNNLAVMNGDHHKQQRRLMQPAFHRQQIAGYYDDMVAMTEATFATWEIGTKRDMLWEMKQLTQRIAVKTLFGTYDEAEIQRVSQLLRVVNQVPLLAVFPFDLPGSPLRRIAKTMEKMEEYILAKIEEKRSVPEATDVLAALVHAHDEDGTRLSDDEMMGHALSLFIAGHETTSHALIWTLLLLHQHPEIHTALLDELESKLQENAPTLEQLNQLPLLEGVVKESLRLLPPAPVGVRRAAHDCELGGYAIPKGAMVFYSEWVTHRLPELYPEPDRFLPQRWVTIKPTIYEYFPFAAGPHMCIGAGFAMQELKVVLAMLVQRYRMELVPNHTLDLNLGMRPTNGMPMTIHRQDRTFAKVPVRGMVTQLVEGV